MKDTRSAAKLSSITEGALDFLLKEYDILKDFYTQSESAVQSLFNFYLTILSAIIGAVILVLQNNTYANITIVIGLLIFSIIIGIFYQSGIVDKHADQMRYAKAINEVRIYLVNHFPETMTSLDFIGNRHLNCDAGVHGVSHANCANHTRSA